MRTYTNENGDTGRPRADRIVDLDTEQISRAAADGRTDVLGPSALLALQRAAGNAGVTAMMSADEVESTDGEPHRDESHRDESGVHDVIGSSGAPLDYDVRADMESRFGADFSDVRVHTGTDAHTSATGLSAQAYTVGSDIVFAQGRYDPASDAGAHMLAHELTHVVQQRSGPVAGTDIGDGVRVSDPGDSYERAASANADHVMGMKPTAQRDIDTDDTTVDAQTFVAATVQREGEADDELEEQAG